MLTLKLNRAPEWLDLIATVRVQVSPLTSGVMMAVKSDLSGLALDMSDTDAMHVALVKAVAQRLITDWQGVGGEDGQPLPVSPAGIDALMDLHRVFAAFDAKVIAPYLLVQSEKKGSAPLPNGTSPGAPNIATAANPSAKNVPTGSTGRKPRKAGRSGI